MVHSVFHPLGHVQNTKGEHPYSGFLYIQCLDSGTGSHGPLPEREAEGAEQAEERVF